MTTRITGLATGLDIDSLVKTTMQAYQTKIDAQTQKKDVLEIKQNLYRDLVQKSQDFFNKYLDRSSKDCLRQSSAFTSVKFTSTNSSGVESNAVTVKGLAGAEAQNYTVKVKQIAQKASKTLKADDLKDIKEIRVNGVAISTVKGDGTAKTDGEIIDDINKGLKDNGISNVKAKYSEFSKGIVIESTNTGRSAEFTLGLSKVEKGPNTIQQESLVVNGTNATAANKGFTIEELRGMDKITVGAKVVDLSTVNSNRDLTAEGKQADYLKAVKKAIDEHKAEDSTVNADDKKLTLNNNGETTNYDITTLRGTSEIKIGDVTVDLSTINNTEELKASGKEIDYLNAVKKAIDDKCVDTISSNVDGKNNELVFNSNTTGESSELVINGSAPIKNGADSQSANMQFNTADLTGIKTITVNGVDIDLSSVTDGDYAKAINDELGKDANKAISGGVTAVQVDGIVTLSTPDKGSSANLSVTGTNSSGEQIFPSAIAGPDVTIQGKNTEATLTDVNGNFYTAVSEKNSVVVDNTQFTFNAITGNEPISVTGANDASELKDKLVKFIDDYNTLITDLNKAVMTKHNKNYPPLTADQKKAMSESEIKLWNEKVEEGQLYRDSDLMRITDSLKSTMRTVMGDTGERLEAIGIKPVKDYTGNKNGTFSIESEDALKEALENNPEDIMNLFIGGTVTNVTAGDNKTGILNQLYYTINKEMFGSSSSLSKKVGFEGTSTFTNNTITNDISDYEDKIKDMQKQYSTKEQALYSKYSTLETAMNKYNSQLSYLTSAFSS